MNYRETETLWQLARSWNNLDICFIETELAENFIYNSQWVLFPIEGKMKFLAYFHSKFKAIKSAMLLEIISITAELAFHPLIQNRPCIVLTQITRYGIVQVSVFITIKKEKISRIDVCFIPDPSDAILTGEIPK